MITEGAREYIKNGKVYLVYLVCVEDQLEMKVP